MPRRIAIRWTAYDKKETPPRNSSSTLPMINRSANMHLWSRRADLSPTCMEGFPIAFLIYFRTPKNCRSDQSNFTSMASLMGIILIVCSCLSKRLKLQLFIICWTDSTDGWQGQFEFVLVTRKTPELKSFETLKVRLKFPARYSIKVRPQVWHNPEGTWALAVVKFEITYSCMSRTSPGRVVH